MKEKFRGDIIYTLVILFLTGYFMQLFNFQMFWMLAICGIFCMIFVVEQKVLRLDIGICLLFITMYSYYIIQYGIRAVITMIPYVPLVMYVMSNYLAGHIKKDLNWEKKLTGILFSLVIGYTIHGLLNSYMYFAGYVKPGTRQWFDFWTRSYKPGTQHSLFFLPVLVMVLPAIIWFRKNKLKNIVIMLVSVFFVYTALATKSRIPILIVAIVLCFEAVLYFMLESKKIKQLLSNKKAWMMIGGLLVTIVVLGYCIKDVAVVKAFIDNLGRGGGILHNVRFELQAKALSQIFEYPMGGRKMDLVVDYPHRYVHNVWLDMANVSGIIPFVAFTAFTVFSIINSIRFLTKKDISSELKVVTAGLYMAFFLFYMIEPALDSSIHYMTPWMMINGLMQGIITKDKIRFGLLRRKNEG